MNHTFDDFFDRLRRRRFIKGLIRFLRYLFLFILVLILSLWFAIQNQSFQNYVLQQVTSFLSKEINATVTAEEIDLRLFNELSLDGFLVEDNRGDTILYAHELEATLNLNLIKIFRKQYDINSVKLKNAQLHIKRAKGKKQNNLKDLLSYFVQKEKDKPNPSGRPTLLSLDRLALENISFRKTDEITGQRIIAFLKEGEILMEHIDLEEKQIDIESIDIAGINIAMNSYAKDTLMVDSLSQKANEISVQKETDEVIKNFAFSLHHFDLKDGKFSRHDYANQPIRSSADNEIDFKHLNVSDIHIKLSELTFEDQVLQTSIESISAKENSGFILKDLSATNASFSKRKINLEGFNLATPHSLLTDNIVLQYRDLSDFGNFKEKVLMKLNFDNSELAIRDILVFAKDLKNNAFIKNNINQTINIDGTITGRLNSLKGQNLNIRLNNTTSLRGSFSSRNLAVKGEEFLNFELDQLRSNMSTIRQILPGYGPPKNFDKVGNFVFNGTFLGFLIDFVANGNLETEIGNASMDMRLNLRKGREEAQYSGNISLDRFDLGKWTGNKQFGYTTLSTYVKEGQGLLLENLQATLGGEIQSLVFRDYKYKNILLDGSVQQNLFDGKLNIQDENIDFEFNGTVDYTHPIPTFDFTADINKIDLFALNLAKKSTVIGGQADIKATDINLSNIEANILLENFYILQEKDTFFLDNFSLLTSLNSNMERTLKVNSDLLDLKMFGNYEIQQVPRSLQYFLANNYPELVTRFGLKTDISNLKQVNYTFDVSIKDTKNWTYLLHPKLDTIRNTELAGLFDFNKNKFALHLDIPHFNFDNVTLSDLVLDANGLEHTSVVHLDVFKTQFKNQEFQPITIKGALNKDTLGFEVNSTQFNSLFSDLSIAGAVFPYQDEYFQLTFQSSGLEFLQLPWTIEENNYIRFGKKFIETQNFELRSGQKNISVIAKNERELEVEIDSIDLGLIDEYWDYDPLDFSETINFSFSAGDIFALEDLKFEAISNYFKINGEDWGRLELSAELEDLTEETELLLLLTKEDKQLNVNGTLAPFKKEGRFYGNDLDLNASIQGFPLHLGEYFISNIISETVGQFDANLKVNGKFSKPNIDGFIDIYDASLKINYTNTTYRIPESRTKVNNSIFDVSDNFLYDSLGNKARLSGGILHNHLKDWRIGAEISTDEFVFLNTNKEVNPIYYGTGIGSGSVSFNGPFNKIDIDINVKTGEGTEVIIPVTYANNSGEVKFIEYIKEKEEEREEDLKKLTELKGVAVNMSIDMTEQADAMLVFDERAGDIIKGNGNGRIQFNVSRLGEISMYGKYNIVKGNYLFTLLNVINKPFVVKEGGTITWEGDPYNAIIDIKAEYKGLNTSLTNFISEYLDGVNPGGLELEARKSHNVLLTMYLSGPLDQPDINFDISFPTLQRRLANIVDSKMRIIRQDQAELNRQVFGLLVIGGFLPPANNSALAGRGGLIPINTISELLSNQLSIHLTELLSEVFTDVDFISGVDFNINYNVYDNDLSIEDGLVRTTGQALQLRQSLDLFEDRLTVQMGGNIDWGGTVVEASNSAFLAGDVVIEYAVTKDRRFKVRAYQLTDATILGRRNKRGLGISWRNEFDTIEEFFGKLKSDAKKTLKEESENSSLDQ